MAKLLLGVLFVFACFLLPPITAKADTYEYYDESRYNIDVEEGIWEVTNSKGPTTQVSLFMMMQPEYAQSSGFRGHYFFSCIDGEFHWSSGRVSNSECLIFYFRPDNKRVYAQQGEMRSGSGIFIYAPAYIYLRNRTALTT